MLVCIHLAALSKYIASHIASPDGFNGWTDIPLRPGNCSLSAACRNHVAQYALTSSPSVKPGRRHGSVSGDHDVHPVVRTGDWPAAPRCHSLTRQWNAAPTCENKMISARSRPGTLFPEALIEFTWETGEVRQNSFSEEQIAKKDAHRRP